MPVGLGLVAVLLHLLIRSLGKEFYLTQLTMAVYYAIVVMGLSLVMGYAGQVSLGQGAFFAMGGYTAAILTTHDFSAYQTAAWMETLKGMHIFVSRPGLYGGEVTAMTPWASFFVAMMLTAGMAFVIGYPSLRLKGHYLAMATLGFGLIIHKIVVGSSLAGAADGINGVPEWNLGGALTISGKTPLRVTNYYVACGLAVVVLIFLRNLIRSRVGRALQAIHDRELAANAMGIPTAAYKLKVFVLSALLAAVAGVFFTHYTGGIGPSEAGALKSVRYVALCAAGGMANLWGVTILSVLVNFMSLRGWFGSYDHAVFGLLLIAMITWCPQGPLKPVGRWIRRWSSRRAGGEELGR
ncbi:MAG TPA: branched-chain amino acid ABC transporter permease [Verrucomicrobiota bacterium]|nr:branched-chain amino acid ABC transporter permease [Verrucomicrobiota bacterium]